MSRAVILQLPAKGPDFGQMVKDAVRPWSDAFESWRSSLDRTMARPRSGTERCDCKRCSPDDCSCQCCVADSDLLVQARAGERRVIPITIENHWRREREVTLELSGWTKVEGVTVSGKLATPGSFTIAPCGDERAILVVEIAGETSPNDGRRDIGDVKDCQVSYADLRVTGCDLRPIRIAVAILPRDCDDYVVDCRSGCC